MMTPSDPPDMQPMNQELAGMVNISTTVKYLHLMMNSTFFLLFLTLMVFFIWAIFEKNERTNTRAEVRPSPDRGSGPTKFHLERLGLD